MRTVFTRQIGLMSAIRTDAGENSSERGALEHPKLFFRAGVDVFLLVLP